MTGIKDIKSKSDQSKMISKKSNSLQIEFHLRRLMNRLIMNKTIRNNTCLRF